jgi:hypothetical protein
MKYTLLALSAILLTGAAYAQQDDDYVSIGYAHINDSDYSGSGVGISAAKINDGNEFGIVSSFDYAEIDISDNTVKYYDVFIGPIYRPKAHDWLRVYPLVGFVYAHHNGDSNSHFAYGGGVQMSLPEQPYYVEVNYKKVDDYDTNIMQFAIGYNF